MSQENVEIARRAIDAINRGDWDAMLQDGAPGIECDLSRSIGPARGVYRGDQVRRVVDEFVGSWASVQIEPHEFIEVGPHVVVPWTSRLTGRNGIEVEARIVWTFTIRDGQIDRLCLYQEREEALEAAGLAE